MAKELRDIVCEKVPRLKEAFERRSVDNDLYRAASEYDKDGDRSKFIEAVIEILYDYVRPRLTDIEKIDIEKSLDKTDKMYFHGKFTIEK